MNSQKKFKGYYLITSKCNLSCSYCVLENSPDQISRELNLNKKMELISHLYNKLNFRSLTISGGEPLIIGEKGSIDFLLLMQFLGSFKSPNKIDNLHIHLYTNGTLITDYIADSMQGIIDEISIDIDSSNDKVLSIIGRNKNDGHYYFDRFLNTCRIISRRGIFLKLHTVICSFNYQSICSEAKFIYEQLVQQGITISSWKFYQYMSYDVSFIDKLHFVSNESFEIIKNKITNSLKEFDINLHFKSNIEMNESLFNILPYGNVQYMRPGDSWLTSRRTKSLLEYQSMGEFFSENLISETLFEQYHLYEVR
jgi:MoaA/NifB/PqqE/SkfB family radical SAM enzyme